ncbi:MAG: phenylalanine--tRNA ligase subunit alpha [Alphaproteobacteria bacterium HGW-Alphaproteobacteria-13]|nr:MAG: phenylalanine--tRNA ligase subunit alpha [Alphaproteobacteria bacterium HGW-Alphaproteobacteria-13]
MSDTGTMQAELLSEIAAAGELDALEALRVAALGKAGRITALLKTLGGMTPEERQEQGPRIHALRESVTAAIADRKAALESAALEAKLAAERLDMTLPADAAPRGSVHPVSQVMDELAEIFADMGFAVATGPEIEDDWHNFTALNIPETHPARAMHDTFYFPPSPLQGRGGSREAAEGEGNVPLSPTLSPEGEREQMMLLRTHTSPVQIRTMMTEEPPIRIIAPGRVYRSDSDATHTPMFHQVEGLVIDRGIHMGHLKYTLETFLKAYFERDDIVLRLRPSYFPFTEPSAEVDVGYKQEKGRRVIANCGLDPDEWQGFAFGVGVDRLAMLKYGMDDLRAFFDGDLRWLSHYGFGALSVPTLSGGISA